MPILKQEGYDLMSAAFEVYNHTGHGFLESVYQECLERELTLRGIPFVSQQECSIFYKSEPLKQTYRMDLVTHGAIIVQLKAFKSVLPEHKAQLMNYIKATGYRVGYLINFGCVNKLEWERIIV